MEAALEAAWNHANIPVELANLRPHGDMVLVRVLPEAKITGLIWHPDGAKENLSPRIGEVIAIGPGDRVFVWICDDCHKTFCHTGPLKHTHKSIKAMQSEEGRKIFTMSTTKSPGTCKACGGTNWKLQGTGHHPMHVKPGDRILYWRTYANEVVLNEELYQLIHEEQHVVGVLED